MIFWGNMLSLLNTQPYHLQHIHAHTLRTLAQFIIIPHHQTQLEVFQMVQIFNGTANQFTVICQLLMLFQLLISITIIAGITTTHPPSLQLPLLVLAVVISLQCHLSLRGPLDPTQMCNGQDLLSLHSLLVTVLVLELEAQLLPQWFLLTQEAMLVPVTESRLSKRTTNSNSHRRIILRICARLLSQRVDDPMVTGAWHKWAHLLLIRLGDSTSSNQILRAATFRNPRIIPSPVGSIRGKEITCLLSLWTRSIEIRTGARSIMPPEGQILASDQVVSGNGHHKIGHRLGTPFSGKTWQNNETRSYDWNAKKKNMYVWEKNNIWCFWESVMFDRLKETVAGPQKSIMIWWPRGGLLMDLNFLNFLCPEDIK